ncbi:hypothetical protein HHO41_21060 [Bacillus sp. DNRA2]|uniref:T7SS effector LXG polymorphic toxin n=1 Tax=Bacillus sp. DNRA2 TaxID=2723053 RepID=UPI00145C7416|nr:T7SS effector LXG polymorphic toxin [Bacillus sp. DNRA2]NMD72720.1 hypothetical protein [Bacillus sp. DNRA2]
MSDLKVFESQTLSLAMKQRADEYRTFKDQLEQLKQAFVEIVQLDDFKGKTATAIKGFYQAQIDVVEAWELFLAEHIRFLDDIDRRLDVLGLSGEKLVHAPFLQDTLANKARNMDEIVSDKEAELKRIFLQIDDILPLEVFSRENFDQQIHQAEKGRKETIEIVYELDRQLVKEYQLTEIQENYTVGLLKDLLEASRKNGVVSAVHFDSEAYHNSETYQLKDEMAKRVKEYLDFKNRQDLAWYGAIEAEESLNRPWYEKVWSGVLIGSGNAVESAVEGLKGMANFGERLDNLAHPALYNSEKLLKYANDVGYFLNAAVSVKDNWRSVLNMPKYIWNAVTAAWDRDFVHGDVESRTAFITSGLTSIGLSILGDNGSSKIGNLAKMGNMAAKSAVHIPKIHNSPELALAGVPTVSKPVPYNVLDDNGLLTQIKTNVDEIYGNGKGTGKSAKDFEKSLVKLPPAERVAAVRTKVQEVAKNNGLIKDSKLSKINGRDVYKDPKTGDLYSVDTQHGRFEKTNSKGKHQGEVDFDFKPTKPADVSGGHNLKIK